MRRPDLKLMRFCTGSEYNHLIIEVICCRHIMRWMTRARAIWTQWKRCRLAAEKSIKMLLQLYNLEATITDPIEILPIAVLSSVVSCVIPWYSKNNWQILTPVARTKVDCSAKNLSCELIASLFLRQCQRTRWLSYEFSLAVASCVELRHILLTSKCLSISTIQTF